MFLYCLTDAQQDGLLQRGAPANSKQQMGFSNVTVAPASEA